MSFKTKLSKQNEDKVCDICIEKYNKTTNILVTCICGYECCRKCCREYLLGKKDEPACMSCKIGWSRDFMVEKLGSVFMLKQYKDFREDLLVEREMGMLQATQPYVEREIRLEQIALEIKETRKILKELQDEKRALKSSKTIQEVERKKFVRKCPNDNCHGFLSTALKCELCGCHACGDCREIKEENHECDKNILESIKLLDKDSKPCPKCTALIFKIEGCDQMYCVECHTAFSWKTLKIESGTIHNPHYFEYQRKINNGVVPRNAQDVQCGREIDNYFITKFMSKFSTSEDEDKNNKITKITDIMRQTIHIRFVEQERFTINNNRLEDNLRLRIDFMRNKITKEQMKKILQKREKENLKKTEIFNILGMFVTCITDVFHRLYKNSNIEGMITEINGLKEYTNHCLFKIGNTFKCKKYRLNKDFMFV
jgi:hypothetical protein